MAVWALIIAIQDYPGVAGGMASVLPGTNAAAETFRNWVIDVKKTPPANIFSCAGNAVAWRTRGTTRKEIGDTLDQLVKAARDNAARSGSRSI